MFSSLLCRTLTSGFISQNSFSSNYAGRFGGAIYDVNVTGESTQPSMACCSCFTSHQCHISVSLLHDVPQHVLPTQQQLPDVWDWQKLLPAVIHVAAAAAAEIHLLRSRMDDTNSRRLLFVFHHAALHAFEACLSSDIQTHQVPAPFSFWSHPWELLSSLSPTPFPPSPPWPRLRQCCVDASTSISPSSDRTALVLRKPMPCSCRRCYRQQLLQ